MKTKIWFAQQILNELENDKRTIDFKIDEREVFLRLDSMVNEMARQNYFDNWKLSGTGIDEQFMTTWLDIGVIDQDNSLPSYLELPARYVALPRNGGIEEIWPTRYVTKNQPSVVIITHRDLRLYASNPAGNLEGRLAGYPLGFSRFYFTTCEVKKKYGNMGVRLIIRDSSVIENDQPYPVPADKEQELIAGCVDWFRARQKGGADEVRDNKDIPA